MNSFFTIITQKRHIYNVVLAVYLPKKFIRICIPFRTMDMDSDLRKEDNV